MTSSKDGSEQTNKNSRGGYWNRLANRGNIIAAGQQVFGVDIASSLLAKCNEDWPNVEADVGDAAALQYEDNCLN